MLINIDDCEGMDLKLCQLAEEKHLTDEQFIYFTKGWQALWGMIIELPSADTPQGEWINDGDTLICSNCKTAFNHPIFHNGWDYCPHCGMKMKGADNG